MDGPINPLNGQLVGPSVNINPILKHKNAMEVGIAIGVRVPP